MSQATIWGVQTEGPAGPTPVTLRINASLNAILSQHSGATAPAYATVGTPWLDTSGSPYLLKVYDGASWIEWAQLDTSAHTFTLSGSSEVTIADVTGLEDALSGKVPTSRTVSAGGIATGGGALSSNQTITVPAASQGEAEAGTENTKAMTALRVAQAITEQVPAASETVAGRVELATTGEAVTGTDTARAVTPAGVAAAIDAIDIPEAGEANSGENVGSGTAVFKDKSGLNLRFRQIAVATTTSGSGGFVTAVSLGIAVVSDAVKITLTVTKGS